MLAELVVVVLVVAVVVVVVAAVVELVEAEAALLSALFVCWRVTAEEQTDTVLVVRPIEVQELPAADEVIADVVLPWLGNGRRPVMRPRSQTSSTASRQPKLR